MDNESTIEEIVKDIPKFRILCVGQAGVGKSSLINRVFGITQTKVSEYDAGEASIGQEFTSNENKHFVLHDSKGFEPGDNTNFNLAAQFLREKHRQPRLRDQLHAIWLCTEIKRASGRVLEEGDKKLMVLAHELGTPVVVVFTKYDMLVSSKQMEEEEDNNGMDEETLRERGKVNASSVFAASVRSLVEFTTRLRIPTPPCINVSVEQGYEESIASLVEKTRRTVHDRLRGDAWVTWAIAQRANLPMKIETCIDKGVNFYHHALAGSILGTEKMLLWRCLARVHQDIITCWNFKDEGNILCGTEFQQLMLYLVQDVQSRSSTTPVPRIDTIAQFVSLVTASTIPLAPPVAVLGLAYFFVKWVSDTVLERIPEVECLLMAYTIDLISVLKSLFEFTLKPELAGATNWEVLKEAFEDYERSNGRERIHSYCRSLHGSNGQILTREGFREAIRKLLGESLGLDLGVSGSQ